MVTDYLQEFDAALEAPKRPTFYKWLYEKSGIRSQKNHKAIHKVSSEALSCRKVHYVKP